MSEKKIKKLDEVDKFCIENEAKTVGAILNMLVMRLKDIEKAEPNRALSNTIMVLENTNLKNEVAGMYAFAVLQQTQNSVTDRFNGAVELDKYDWKDVLNYIKRNKIMQK